MPMTQPQQPPPQPRVGINLPPEQAAGVFANFAAIWQDNDGFVIDFAALIQAPRPGEDDNGAPTIDMQANIVSRVRIPPRQALELMRGLNSQLTLWEAAHGPVADPPPPGS